MMPPIQADNLNLSAEARKFLPPAPAAARNMAARGMVPLPPIELITVQAVLAFDEDPGIAEAARLGITSHPENVLIPVAQNLKDASVLDFLASCAIPAAAKEALVLNRNVSDVTLVSIAKNEKSDRVLDILSGNQARMLGCILIAETLIENTHLTFATKRRLEEFFEKDFADKILADPAPIPAVAPPVSNDAMSLLTGDLAAALGGPLLGTGDAAGTLTEDLLKEFIEETPESAAAQINIDNAPSKKLSLYKIILAARVSEKIKLAIKGNKEARSILIKDSNKMVCTGVLKNSRITDGEVAMIASSKSSIEDLLRIIAGNPAWMRKYNIKFSLIQNPKTPFAIASKILPSLLVSDVQTLSKSKSVSGALQQAARRLAAQHDKKR